MIEASGTRIGVSGSAAHLFGGLPISAYVSGQPPPRAPTSRKLQEFPPFPRRRRAARASDEADRG
jgi:hypothetical protein